MMKSTSRQVFPAGKRIYSHGDSARFAYLIEQGTVEVSSAGDDGKAAHRRLGAGDLLGGEALAGSGVRPATATAIEDTHAIAIDRDQFQDRMQDADELLQDVLRAALRNSHSGGAIDDSAENLGEAGHAGTRPSTGHSGRAVGFAFPADRVIGLRTCRRLRGPGALGSSARRHGGAVGICPPGGTIEYDCAARALDAAASA